jgi:pSer/pThr/pTyr-binding forkhead associated (FHA) protein
MTARLIEIGVQGNRTKEFLLGGEEFMLGRGRDCDLRLRDASISRHHCMIRMRRHEATLVDLGSSNGTYVNGNRVISQAALKSGDEITLGEFHFHIDLGEGGRSEVVPKTTLHLSPDTHHN